jgi:hypothetical protein
MAETTTITRPAPIIEGSLTAFLKSIDKLGAGAIPAGGFTGIDPSKYKPTIADESQLQQFARTQAGGLGSLMPMQAGETAQQFQDRQAAFQSAKAAGTAGLVGADSYQAFMSPYQREVIDETLSEFDRQQTIADTARRDQAIQAGAYGGGREGVLAAESARGAATSRSNLQAQLLAQGFQQAQAAAANQLAAQQGLGQYQQSLGQAGQAQQQAVIDAAAAAEREQQFQPFTQLGLIGQQLAQIQPGAFPTQTVGYAPPAAPASPLATALGVGTGVASIGSKLGLFG